MKVRRGLVCFTIVLLFLCGGIFASGQATTYGQLRGEVTDPTGAVIPGATLTLKNVATGATQNIQTNNAGLY